MRRIVERYRAEGLSGLVSMKRGQPSNRRLTDCLFRPNRFALTPGDAAFFPSRTATPRLADASRGEIATRRSNSLP
ncbi:MAG: hypothetical protein ACYCY5_12000 [Sulfuricella sp.]